MKNKKVMKRVLVIAIVAAVAVGGIGEAFMYSGLK